MQNRPLLKYKLHHVFFWMLVFGVWYFLRYEDYAVPGRAFTITLIKVIDLALMIYITNYVLLPKLFYKKKYALFVLCFVLLVVTSSVLKMNILGRIMDAPQLYSLSGDLKRRIYDNVLPHFFLVIAGAAVKLMIDYSRLQQRMAETAKEKAEAELNFLKSQINPHFLFNSLNSVYFLIDKNNTEARESLHKFSDMLRYQLYEMKGDKIPVEREINYLKDYVDLQKLRKDDAFSVYFNCSPTVAGFSIEPLLLVPFVENAFKHVSSHAEKENFIRFNLDRHNGQMIFSAENSKDKERTNDTYSGIGLNNVKRRLELLYPGRHELTIRDEENVYKVNLKIKIDI
ncbi:sensor histidine kinase [Terrimonas pollutisoli]|uniref:sensor histidine kinase n=1 Tax=Terrimonas pollutisoli TaxID=3034147 RepID=UPI0023EB0E83|nr:histidine kinase [Terrimonas sp. H1YJ31]